MSTQNRSRALPAVRGLAPEPTLSTRSRRTRKAPASAEAPTSRPAGPEAATQRASIRPSGRHTPRTQVLEHLHAVGPGGAGGRGRASICSMIDARATATAAAARAGSVAIRS